jgi:hypothetical protein
LGIDGLAWILGLGWEIEIPVLIRLAKTKDDVRILSHERNCGMIHKLEAAGIVGLLEIVDISESVGVGWARVEYGGKERALGKGVAIDAQDDESSEKEVVRKLKVTDIGKSGGSHDDERSLDINLL